MQMVDGNIVKYKIILIKVLIKLLFMQLWCHHRYFGLLVTPGWSL